MHTLSDDVTKKFVDVIDLDEWVIETDTGWHSALNIKQTIPYDVWHVELDDGNTLDCADDHIVFLDDYTEIFVKNLRARDHILTRNGSVLVNQVYKTTRIDNMYDIGIDSEDKRYYTNNVLSHNTTCAAGYILWRAMFISDQTILIAAHKGSGAQEIMQRIRFGYELCQNFIRSGAVNTGRGMSISLLYCLDGNTLVKIRNKDTLVEEEISLANLYERLYA